MAAVHAEEVDRLPPRVKAPLVASRPLAWQSLAVPGELLKRLADEAAIQIKGADQVPHDLLAATDLPAMPWIDRLALVAVQFGLTFKIDLGGRVVELVPIGEPVAIERSYPAGRDARETIERWKQLAPEAEIELASGRIVVRGRIEDHEKIAPARSGKTTTIEPRGGGTQVYTLKMEQVPLDGFLEQLGQKLAMKIELDRDALAAAGIKPASPVDVDVQNATLDELLRAALSPLGLESARSGKTITVTVRKEKTD